VAESRTSRPGPTSPPFEPPLASWAPGRVNLIGEHTDYSGGLVLPAAIELGITVSVTARSETVELTSQLLGRAEPFAADGRGPAAHGWARYAQAVAVELDELGRPAAGLAGSIASSLPAGAGLSSSAALEVAIALALCGVAGFELEPMELAQACRRAEFRAVGVPCGILDPAASILGRDGTAVLLDCATLEHRLVSVPEHVRLLVVDSGVARSLENTAYADRKGELERALDLVGAERSTAVGLADLGGLDPVSKRRLRHVVTENERVGRFAEAFERGDLATSGAILVESHASLRDDYEVSIPELDRLVELALEAGAYGARLLGAGFGGAVLALVDRERAAAVGEAIASSYRPPSGAPGRVIDVQPSQGARILPGAPAGA
jgi:galactokinase